MVFCSDIRNFGIETGRGGEYGEFIKDKIGLKRSGKVRANR